MSVLSKYFSKKVNQCSPVQKDYERMVNYDEDGNEFITFVEVDYPSIQAANGVVEDWSLKALLAAGINPNFGIHTGNPTRLEGIGVVNDAAAIAESIINDAIAAQENKDVE